MAGRHSGLFSALSGSLVALPALHAAATVLPAAPAGIGHAAKAFHLRCPLTLAAAVVAAMVGGQKAFKLVTSARRFPDPQAATAVKSRGVVFRGERVIFCSC